MNGFTFIGVFIVSFIIVTFGSFVIGYIVDADDTNEPKFAFAWLTACVFFAAYIAWNMVLKNG